MDVANRLRRRATGPLILELDLTEGLAEGQPSDPVQAVLAMRRTRLLDVLDGLRRAATDNRVRAVVVKVGGGRIGLARIQELRNAITEFRKSGKLTVAWSESFGEFTRGNLPFYLATAFEKIYLQPTGTLGLTGIAVEQVFLHDALAKLGVDFESGKRYEYKTAADPLTETGFTAPARETTQRLAESVVEQLVAGIAEGRGIGAEQVRDLLDRGPFLARQALEAGLVDVLAYRDEVYEDVRRQVGTEATPLYIGRYQRVHALAELPRRAASAARDPQVALIYAHGPIRQGRAPRGPFANGGIGSDTLSGAIRAAVADSRIRSIVMRVSSPGGSAVASDTIWREVVRARAAGKPVVISMGDVAASGGYYISMGADVIVTQPGTLTGSIGVIMGKPVFRELFARTGVTTDTVALGANGGMFSTARPFSEEEWARVDEWLDAIYSDFTSKVAQARHLSAERVDELARGRVWTGADAVARGLADEVGGLRDALAIARQRAGLPESAPVRLFPRVSPLEQLRATESSEVRPAAGLIAGASGALVTGAMSRLFSEGWGPLGQLAARAGLPPYGPLMLPGTWTIS
jgi:protease-4